MFLRSCLLMLALFLSTLRLLAAGDAPRPILSKVRSSNVEQPSAVDVGNHLELFVDRHLIDTMRGTELKLHHPTLAESVLKFDKPWEGAFCGYTTVFQDGDRFRMYYRGLPRAGRDGTDAEVTCYAESKDGIHWQKPNVGIFEVDGSTDNNIVLKGQTPASHNFSPFLDANPTARTDQRYKALGGTSGGLLAFISADGLNWRRTTERPGLYQRGLRFAKRCLLFDGRG